MGDNEKHLTDEIDSLENEIAERKDRLVELKKKLCGELVRNYLLKGPADTAISLSEMFGEHRDLIVVHNMGSRCAYCTLWADGLNGLYPHLINRTAFAVVSPDAPEQQQSFAESRGWRFPMYSNEGAAFTADMGFTNEVDGKTWYTPGFSTFSKQADGTIVRVARDTFGPGDQYCALWPMIELLDGGACDWRPRLRYPVSTEMNVAADQVAE